MRRNRLFRLTACILCLTFLLTGCWDKIEIEDRSFVLGIAFDKAKEEEKLHPNDRYLITFASPQLGSGKGGAAEGFKTYSSVGDSFSECMLELLQRFSKKQYFGHTRAVFMGEELMRDEKSFKELLDNIGRSHELYKNMYIYTVPGRATDAFGVKPVFDKLLMPYITGITDNNLYEATISKIELSDFSIELSDLDGAALMPVLEPQQEGVNISKLAVIKDFKLAGYLTSAETSATNWLRNKAEGGVIEANINNAIVPFRYFTMSTKIRMDRIEGNKIYITYTIETEGTAEEYTWGKELMDEKMLETLGSKLENEIVTSSKSVIKRYQEDFKVDLIGLRGYLSKFHPHIFKGIEKNYNEYFSSNIVINVNAKVNVRRVGMTK